MRALPTLLIALLIAGCADTRYQAPLSARAPTVPAQADMYVGVLEYGYASCLPSIPAKRPTTDAERAAYREGLMYFSPPNCSKETISDFQDAGLTLSDIYCDEFFRQANDSSRRRRFARGATNDVGGAIQAILGLAKAAKGVISGIGAGTAFLDSTFRNYDDSFMVDADLSRMRRLVNAAQDKMRLDMRAQDKDEANSGTLTIFAAESRIRRYAGLCTFLGMKNLLDTSLAESTKTLEDTNKKKQPELTQGTDAGTGTDTKKPDGTPAGSPLKPAPAPAPAPTTPAPADNTATKPTEISPPAPVK